MHKVVRSFLLFPALLAAFLAFSHAGDEKPPQRYEPKVAPASKEKLAAMKRLRLPKGLAVDLYAAEPLLANPVCFCFDENGRCYVAETFRLHAGVTDNRGHMNWLDDDLAARSVADRLALYRKYLKDRVKDYEKEHDRVRLLLDTDGDGKPDRAVVFADGFHRAEDGIGAGLLARKGKVYYTCIPDLWRLQDTDGDGKAGIRESLSTGYGVHVSFIGHDMHGLRLGPDGKLYFSIGDRGLNVRTKEGKRLFHPDTGAVLRCDLDGANLEVVATGLRNPQELAFDDFGNLFTVDNNSDSGDQARLVYVVEGGDSGWHIGYQYGSRMHDERSRMGNRGPWNYEKLWHLKHDGQPAYIVPPLAHIAAGPSGLCHYPGVGLGERYAGHFFLCDFRGEAGGSGVWSFAVKPKGAAFEIADAQQFVWSVLATDCDFGPDGAFYISDWVQGWDLTGKGRIWKVTDPDNIKKPAVAEAKKLLAEGFDHRKTEELVKLLGHPHQQVRLEAQFTLVAKGKGAIEPLAVVAKTAKNRLARLHAIWGLGQFDLEQAEPVVALTDLLKDNDAEVRAQAAKALGTLLSKQRRQAASLAKVVEGLNALTGLLKDESPRVRFLASVGLSKLGKHYFGDLSGDQDVRAGVVAGARTMLRDNDDRDPYLRHAGVLLLTAFGPDAGGILKPLPEPTPPERLAMVLAYRRQAGHRYVADHLARFLADTEPHIVAEAARAIHDEPVPKAFSQLAALVEKPKLPETVLYRALNANFRLGKVENAVAVAKFSARGDAPEALRVEALQMLGEWSKPGRRDRVTGLTQDLGTRPVGLAAEAIKPSLGRLFSGPNRVRQEAARVASKLGIREVGPVLVEMLGDRKRPAEVRVEALRGLDALRDARLQKAVDAALDDEEPLVRSEGRRVLARLNPDASLNLLEKVLREGDALPGKLTPEQKRRADRIARQGAFAVLGAMGGTKAEALLSRWLDRLLAKEVEAELRLDLLEAARALSTPALKAKVARYEAARPKNDSLAPYRETLTGGSADEGRRIFLNKAEVSCLRCHKLNGEGGDVGPDLAGIGSKQTREYLLESLVEPSKQIARGFETVVLTTSAGKVVSGIIKAEDKKSVRLITAEGKLVTIAVKDIEDRQTGKSAMPDDLVKHLSPRELRDLVEFLAELKETKK